MHLFEGMPVFEIPKALILVIVPAFFAVVALMHRYIRKCEMKAVADPVTGGLNRAGLEDKARKFLSGRNVQHAVVTMELRNYRQLLHTFGTEKTYQTLKYLQGILKHNLGAAEPMARLNGGTFCFLIKNRQADAIRARLTRLYETANQFNAGSRTPYFLDLRFAVCIPEGGRDTLAEILENNDEMLENSDQRVVFFHEEDKDAASHKWELIQQMDRSLRNDDFLVYLQPKVRLSDNRIAGAEALIRWRHPQRGMLTPGMFVPLLEEYHLVSRFDLYVFEQVCRQMQKWTQAGMTPCPVSVNLSYETFDDKDFLDNYSNIARKYGVSPELIEFELGKVLQNQSLKRIASVVEEIHARNFRCALDHFGGEIVSLHLLRDLNVDTIKLNKTFFSGENNNRRNRFVVEAIIKTASQMQMRTVAEGIDNVSQVRYLKQAGCDMIQGYYYFTPLSVEEFNQAAYHKGELRYLEEEGKQPAKMELTPNQSSSSIVMFSLLTATDRVMFSHIFSPVLENQQLISSATSLFRYSDLIHENDRKDFFHLLERCAKEDGWVENAIRFYTSEGRYEWLEVHMHKEYIPATDETVVSGTLVNITGWKNEVNRWKEKANRDALTGLYNREYFEYCASSSMEKGLQNTAAVVFVDIDDFKKVNDTLGHVVGDDVICWFAKRMLGTFRHSDIVARYGGDEFVVFVNGIGREELDKRLQELSEGFRFPYRNGEITYNVSGSIGGAMFPEDGKSYLELLDHADAALYEAKRQGKNRYVLYYPGLEETSHQ